MTATGLILMALSLGGKAPDGPWVSTPVDAGTIIGYDEEGIIFLPAGADKPVRIPWHKPSPTESKPPRMGGPGDEEELGEAPFAKVDGVVVTLKSKQKLKGVFLSERETEDAIYIKTSSHLRFEVKKADILSIEAAEFPAPDVYASGELYALILGEIAPITARDHFETARRCMKASLYKEARDHLVRCAAIDPLYEERISDMFAELELRTRERQARNLYEKMLQADAAGDRDRALELIGQLQRAFPDCPDTAKAAALKPEIETKKGKTPSP